MSRPASQLHPVAWWLWAMGLGAAASRTTNPLLLGLIVAVVGFVVAARRPARSWARGFRAYLLLGLVVVGIRTVFHIALGGGYGDTVLLRLPQLRLPAWTAGIQLGGAVTAEGLSAAVYDGMRLATLLICVGAAVTLADPRRLLRTLPGALYELGVVVVVAVSLAPELVDSALRVRRARTLRGGTARGLGALRAIAMPVLAQALDRAVSLAASMDARGYGRAGAATAATRRCTAALLLVGLFGMSIGAYGLLDSATPGSFGWPGLLVGLVAAVAGLALGSRRVVRSRYRNDPVDAAAIVVAGSGLLAAAAMLWAELHGDAAVFAATSPWQLPQLSLLPALGVLAGLLPAWAAPPPDHDEIPARRAELVAA